jgi:hypothetical protein
MDRRRHLTSNKFNAHTYKHGLCIFPETNRKLPQLTYAKVLASTATFFSSKATAELTPMCVTHRQEPRVTSMITLGAEDGSVRGYPLATVADSGRPLMVADDLARGGGARA